MSTAVVMVTVSERVEALNRFLRSLAQHEPGRQVLLHMQGDNRLDEIEWPSASMSAFTMHSPERMGCHAARVRLLQDAPVFDNYVNVDDDVVLTEHTHWQPAIEKAREPGVGFVLTNWVKAESMLPKAVKIMADEFLPQVFVYQGGGMAYTEEVARLMRQLSPVPARYDDIWPLTTYLNGYRNYRYRGSLAIHKIMGRGGMQAYMRAEPRPLLCWDWVDYKLIVGAKVGSDYHIPVDKDLRPAARAQHAAARAERGW